MMRAWQKGAICMTTVVAASIAAVAQNERTVPPDLGPKAVQFVVAKIIIDHDARVPKTKKPLPTNGSWTVSLPRSVICPQTVEPCITVHYRVPEADVSCEWTVLLSPDGSTGQLLAENDESARYFIIRLGQSEAAAFVQSRAPAVDPPIALAANMTGDVRLRAVVGPDGIPETFVVLSGAEMLKSAALDSGGQWRFKPYKVGDRAVRFQVEMTFTFRGEGHFSPPVVMQP